MGPENALIHEIRRALAVMPAARLFLVGGSVRDILLGKPITDYDFLLEGDLFSFANLLGERLRSRVIINRRLLTAALRTKWGNLDISRARRETYLYPGDLPAVFPAAWQEDLSRRDFTVNTLLLPLYPDGWGELLDLCNGIQDLTASLLRVLHRGSFREDPTRILRGIRLRNRLGFKWDPETLACLVRAWTYLNLVSPRRRLKEWILICQEEETAGILDEIHSLGGWEAFCGSVPYLGSVAARIMAALDEAKGLQIRPWYLALLILLSTAPEEAPELGDYWGLPAKDLSAICETLSLAAKQGQIWYPPKRSVYREIRQLPEECLFYLYLEHIRGVLGWEDWSGEVKKMRMPLRGKDLLNLGLLPGIKLGRLLKRLEDSYWREEFTTREEGLLLAGKLIQEENTCLISGK